MKGTGMILGLQVCYTVLGRVLGLWGATPWVADQLHEAPALEDCLLHLHGTVHPVVASAARELLNTSENERSGVLSTTKSFLELYRNLVVARATEEATHVALCG
jgi:hypothetical protein